MDVFNYVNDCVHSFENDGAHKICDLVVKAGVHFALLVSDEPFGQQWLFFVVDIVPRLLLILFALEQNCLALVGTRAANLYNVHKPHLVLVFVVPSNQFQALFSFDKSLKLRHSFSL